MNCFGVNDTAIQWFTSYLKGWKSQVNIAGVLSESIQVDFGLPQGSVLGPARLTLRQDQLYDQQRTIVRCWSLS